MVSAMSDIDMNRLRTPPYLDMNVSNEWMNLVSQQMVETSV